MLASQDTSPSHSVSVFKRLAPGSSACVVLTALSIAIASTGCETTAPVLNAELDFKTMPAVDILGLLQSSNSITVSTSGTGVHADSWLKDEIARCNDPSSDGPEDGCYQTAGHANQAIGNQTHVAVDFYQLMRGRKPAVQPEPGQVRFAVEALLRGCGQYAADESTARGGRTCASLGGLLYALGNTVAAAAVWERATGCFSYDKESPVNRCMDWALSYRSVYASDPQRLVHMARKTCDTIHDRDACQFLSAQGAAVDMAAVAQAESDRHEATVEYRAQRAADLAQSQADSAAHRDAILGALQSMPGANDPNAIVNAGNQQAAAIRALADANATRQQQFRTASQAALLQGDGSVASTPLAATASRPADGGSSVSAASAGPGSSTAANGNSVAYLAPLPSSCVRQFWDPQYYNWLSFGNLCAQTITLTFIFNHPVGWAMTGQMILAPGAQQNTGRSSSDITQAGGLDMYICPANTVPVDMKGNTFNSNISQYQCKRL